LGGLELTQEQVCPRLVKFIPFAKVQDDLFRILKTILEIDKVKHEIADGVKDYILRQDLWDSHGIALAFFLTSPGAIAAFFSAPEWALERLAKIIDISHEITGLFHHMRFVLLEAIFLNKSAPVFFFLDGLLKFLVQNFLKDAFPNVFFLPNSMVIHKLGQVFLL
jgi:hypothetical protein